MGMSPPLGSKLNRNPSYDACIHRAISDAKASGIDVEVATYEYCMAASYHARWCKVTTYFTVNGKHRLSVPETKSDQEIADWINSFVPSKNGATA